MSPPSRFERFPKRPFGNLFPSGNACRLDRGSLETSAAGWRHHRPSRRTFAPVRSIGGGGADEARAPQAQAELTRLFKFDVAR